MTTRFCNLWAFYDVNDFNFECLEIFKETKLYLSNHPNYSKLSKCLDQNPPPKKNLTQPEPVNFNPIHKINKICLIFTWLRKWIIFHTRQREKKITIPKPNRMKAGYNIFHHQGSKCRANLFGEMRKKKKIQENARE